jgi:hypothetical protein
MLIIKNHTNLINVLLCKFFKKSVLLSFATEHSVKKPYFLKNDCLF